MPITVTTANICGNPLRPKWAVRKRMRRALTQPDVVFGQEVARTNRWATNNYSTMWHRVATRLGKATYGGGHEVPISLPKDWDVTGSEVIHVTPGKKNISPDRYIVVASAEVGGQRVAFVNCHPVSQPRRSVPFGRWRMSMWDTYRNKLVEVVAGLVDSGHTVIFGGDMNKNAVPVVHPRQVALIGAGLDHLWAAPADGVTVTVTSKRAIGRTVLMDHPILTATITLEAAR